MERQRLTHEITRLLKSATGPLLTREILDRLRNRRGVVVTLSDVKAVLESDLAANGLATKDAEFRWTFTVPEPAPVGRASAPAGVASGSSESAKNEPPAPLRNLPPPTPRAGPSVLSGDELASVQTAVAQEIAAAAMPTGAAWLDIDGIEQLPHTAGAFAYRLALSSPVHLAADQPVTFQLRNPNRAIRAVVVAADDAGLVVACEEALPPDAQLVQVTFDPTFILRALERFIFELAPTGGEIARLVTTRTVPVAPPCQPWPDPTLNEDQCRAIEEMASAPVTLLWGPPGTGKTTTLGAAVARWLRDGKRVLVMSTSNAAVDVAMRSVLARLHPAEKGRVLRLGSSLDEQVRDVTLAGKLAAANPTTARLLEHAQSRLTAIQEQLRSRTLAPDRADALNTEAREHERQVVEFRTRVGAAGPDLRKDVQVTGCTLAKMVLDPTLRAHVFDVVVVDEASMASLLYATAASMLAGGHIVYAGDPKQLPPIVQADGAAAARWFGRNVYDWFGVGTEGESGGVRPSVLRTQYRMTDEIGGVVSRLSYASFLRHGRGKCGPKVTFIDVGPEWETKHYDVEAESYYHPATIPLVHGLTGRLRCDDLLLLTPFRPQRSLLAALAFDLSQTDPTRRVTASTIHRAQGSEARAVIVDLTSHDPDSRPRFFKDQHCDRLFNVAISRARDHLVVIGSRRMVEELAGETTFWRRVLTEFGSGIVCLDADEVMASLEWSDRPRSPTASAPNLPALYSHASSVGSLEPGLEALRRVPATRKLLVTPKTMESVDGGMIVRTSGRCPPVFAGGGRVCLPRGGRWVAVPSPNASRVLWRVGFSHLADAEVDPNEARRFYCAECRTGNMALRQLPGEGWFLVCTNGQSRQCACRRRLSLEDAKRLVRLQGVCCGEGHPMTARTKRGEIFLGCENYPNCKQVKSLAVLRGV